MASQLLGANRVCELCDYFNSDLNDDPITAPALHYPGGMGKRDAPSIAACDNSASNIAQARERCRVMYTSRVFIPCNHVVDPE